MTDGAGLRMMYRDSRVDGEYRMQIAREKSMKCIFVRFNIMNGHWIFFFLDETLDAIDVQDLVVRYSIQHDAVSKCKVKE